MCSVDLYMYVCIGWMIRVQMTNGGEKSVKVNEQMSILNQIG